MKTVTPVDVIGRVGKELLIAGRWRPATAAATFAARHEGGRHKLDEGIAAVRMGFWCRASPRWCMSRPTLRSIVQHRSLPAQPSHLDMAPSTLLPSRSARDSPTKSTAAWEVCQRNRGVSVVAASTTTAAAS